MALVPIMPSYFGVTTSNLRLHTSILPPPRQQWPLQSSARLLSFSVPHQPSDHSSSANNNSPHSASNEQRPSKPQPSDPFSLHYRKGSMAV